MEKGGGGKNLERTLQLEESENRRRRGVPRPYPHVGRDTAEIFGIKLHGISERKEQPDAECKIP